MRTGLYLPMRWTGFLQKNEKAVTSVLLTVRDMTIAVNMELNASGKL